MIKKNYYKYIKFCIAFFAVSFLLLFSSSFAATPKIIDKMSKAFEEIEKWLLKLSTPATAVAVAVGLFMKKFSFGDEERIRTAKKIIKGSLVAYAILLALDLILAAIKSLIG